MLSRQQVSEVVRDKETYYSGMLRNGWLLPDIRQSIVTLSFMERVRAGEIFCPHVNTIETTAVCLTPPPKQTIINKLMAAAEERESAG